MFTKCFGPTFVCKIIQPPCLGSGTMCSWSYSLPHCDMRIFFLQCAELLTIFLSVLWAEAGCPQQLCTYWLLQLCNYAHALMQLSSECFFSPSYRPSFVELASDPPKARVLCPSRASLTAFYPLSEACIAMPSLYSLPSPYSLYLIYTTSSPSHSFHYVSSILWPAGYVDILRIWHSFSGNLTQIHLLCIFSWLPPWALCHYEWGLTASPFRKYSFGR